MMKATLLLLFIAARRACGTLKPTLQWDPETAKDCVEWYNNSEDESCDYVRGYFGITPDEFHRWNPSVGLDCEPWDYQSYCIVTWEKLNNTATTTTTSSSSSSTTTSTSSTVLLTPGPSPTSWTALGCYVENPSLPILEKNFSPAGGDAALTIPKCKNTCYRRVYGFAGVQEGNQCWCSGYVGGEWAGNQTDCNIPCSGDSNTFCGGKGLINVFKAEQNVLQINTSTTSVSISISTTGTASTTTSSQSQETVV